MTDESTSADLMQALGVSLHKLSINAIYLQENQDALVSAIAQIDVLPLKPRVAVATPIQPVFDIPDPPPEVLAERLKPKDPNNPRLAIIVPFRDSLSQHSQVGSHFSIAKSSTFETHY